MTPFPHTDRDRLLAVIILCEQHGWLHTLRHAQETFYHLSAGHIERAF